MISGSITRREDRDAALEALARPQPEREVLARREHDVADEFAVGVQAAAVVRDEDAASRCDWRDRRAAAVENDCVRIERRREARALERVRREWRAGHSAARAPTAHRWHACECRGL